MRLLVPAILLTFATSLSAAAVFTKVKCPTAGSIRVSVAGIATPTSDNIHPDVFSGLDCAAKCQGSNFYIWEIPNNLCECTSKCIRLSTEAGYNVNNFEIGVPSQLCPVPGTTMKVDTVDYASGDPFFYFVGTPEACAAKCLGYPFYFLTVVNEGCSCSRVCNKVDVLPTEGLKPYVAGTTLKPPRALTTASCPQPGKTAKADVVNAVSDIKYLKVTSAAKCAAACKGYAFYWWFLLTKECNCAKVCTKLEGVPGTAFVVGALSTS